MLLVYKFFLEHGKKQVSRRPGTIHNSRALGAVYRLIAGDAHWTVSLIDASYNEIAKSTLVIRKYASVANLFIVLRRHFDSQVCGIGSSTTTYLHLCRCQPIPWKHNILQYLAFVLPLGSSRSGLPRANVILSVDVI